MMHGQMEYGLLIPYIDKGYNLVKKYMEREEFIEIYVYNNLSLQDDPKEWLIDIEQKVKTFSAKMGEAIYLSEDEISLSIDAFYKVYKSIGKRPEEFEDEDAPTSFYVKDCFDLQKYCATLNYLSFDDNYVMEYGYSYSECAGSPVLYCRKITEDPPVNYSDLMRNLDLGGFHSISCSKDINFKERNFLPIHEAVKAIEPSPLGYFQFAVFSSVVNQIYLFGHSYYDFYEFIYTKNDFYESLKTNSDSLRDIDPHIDPRPKIQMTFNGARIRLLCYNETEGYLYTYIGVTWPNKFVTLNRRALGGAKDIMY